MPMFGSPAQRASLGEYGGALHLTRGGLWPCWRLSSPQPWSIMLIYGAAELTKYFINRARVELLKETKQVQLQVLELHDLVRKGGVS
jgi:hypothetical protein